MKKVTKLKVKTLNHVFLITHMHNIMNFNNLVVVPRKLCYTVFFLGTCS